VGIKLVASLFSTEKLQILSPYLASAEISGSPDEDKECNLPPSGTWHTAV
jgi:hypothetical protein